jgi:hypothetical protein
MNAWAAWSWRSAFRISASILRARGWTGAGSAVSTLATLCTL